MGLAWQSMFRSPTSRVRGALAIAALAALVACGGWPGPVPIDPSLWDIEIITCGVDPNENLEGMITARGRVVNTGDERSPFYDLAYRVVYTDGHVEERESAGEIIEPMDPEEGDEFWFPLLESDGRTIESCEAWVVDAVENYT